MQRFIFVNLHGNEFLVKTMNKILFKQSAAIKHKYFLDYLLQREDVEVCTFLNKKSFSLSYSHADKVPLWISKLEHRFVLRKNGISYDKIKVLTSEKEIRKEDILITYNYYANHFCFDKRPDCLIANSFIHFNVSTADSLRKIMPDVLYNEANFQHGSKIFEQYYSWLSSPFITIPFVFADRFKPIVPFNKRKDKCFSTGTVTYMPHIVSCYGDSCAQPARRQILVHKNELEPWVDCYNSNYLEDTEKKRISSSNVFARLYNLIYDKFYAGRQKKYFSFDMVEKFNDYKMCLVGEEIMQIPGVGFVEGMACGTAYIGQTIGYYEDYGLQEGVHYVGYDGTIDDLKRRISYYQQPEHQKELERIAQTGCEYVRKHFCGPVIAEKLANQLIELSKNRIQKQG